MPTHVLHGSTAFPEFRTQQLEEAASNKLATRVTLKARFIYLLDSDRALTEAELQRASELLGADLTSQPHKNAIYVSPRKGTISPWSSRATDIFHQCGLSVVRRVERAIEIQLQADGQPLSPQSATAAFPVLHDRMIEGVYTDLSDTFEAGKPAQGRTFDVLGEGISALQQANEEMGLALSDEEIEYLAAAYQKEGKNPSDTELLMFGQVNSEHCRHKIFNAEWIIDGVKQDTTLFKMIRHTHAMHPEGTLVAYSDNSGVMEGHKTEAFRRNPTSRQFTFNEDQIDILMKVETHNHPTAISPFPGASTGVGGEIRDESATGRGSESRAGISGLITSHLRIPGYALPWEQPASTPPKFASPMDIVKEGSIGGASLGNEFGRPQLGGFFRTYEETTNGTTYGYNKPILLAGGMGAIARDLIHKHDIPAGSLIVQLGGPAMRIGLGGGAASSLASSGSNETLDFNSVQRGNADMQRRCQEVIDDCTSMGKANPILAIHDIGAGGLSNGCPELVEKTGGRFDLRKIDNADPSMSPMEIWCCEAQERYVLAIAPESRAYLEQLCARERCHVAFIGVATGDHRLVLTDSLFNNNPIDMNIDVLLGKPPRMLRDVSHDETPASPLTFMPLPSPAEALERVLRHPTVADKTFLISGTDRTATGLVHRDQFCGPYQLPVADHAIVATSYRGTTGSAMACGERTPIGVINGPASGRLAVTEAVLNIATAAVGNLNRVKLSANWMCACGEPGEDAKLFDTVKAVAIDFCPALGISIPVGKDSLSMRSHWTDPTTGKEHHQISPLSLIITAFAAVDDIRLSVTPDLKPGASSLLLIDLARGKNRLGASILAQTYNRSGGDVPDMDNPADLLAAFTTLQTLLKDKRILAAHDRSDGGLATTLVEMCIAGGRGTSISLPAGDSPTDELATLFSEEPGMVIQISDANRDAVLNAFADVGLADAVSTLGPVTEDKTLRISFGKTDAINAPLAQLRSFWSENAIRIRAMRDNPVSAEQERTNAQDANDPGLTFALTYDIEALPTIRNTKAKPRAAILREQGLNGHLEMAAALTQAGFDVVDVHMTDLLSGSVNLADFKGAIACGSASYGDALGAGSGWARAILYNDPLSDMFATFFHRPDTFTLGVNNGCQLLAQLKAIIPGTENWPRFVRNTSDQFEARYCTAEVLDSPAVLLKGMAGARIPIPVAHAEGLVVFESSAARDQLIADEKACLRYVDNLGQPTERYPYNPNGSAGGLTAFTSQDGRALIMMPHPERAYRAVQLSYRPAELFANETGPWMRMFHNARAFV